MSKGFDPADIEKQINSELARLPSDNIRTSLFNLVFFYRDHEEYIIEKMLDYLFGKRPARIIHIQNCLKKITESYVKLRCYPDSDNKQVCFQEIIIQNGLDGMGAAPGTWAPLLLHEIPTIILWFTGLGTHLEMLKPISGLADKLIFCTEWNESLRENPLVTCTYLARDLLPLLESTPHCELIISDLTWVNTLHARRTIAGFFDPPDMRAHLYDLQKVISRGSTESEALLLFLWLASRLSWSLEPSRGRELTFKDQNGAIINTQTEKKGKKEFAFLTRDAKEFTVSLTEILPADSRQAFAQEEKSLLCSLAGRRELLEELDSLEPDPLYYQALKILAGA